MLDWNLYTGQTVRIYRNLNNGRMSIQALVERRWLVVGHVTDCVICDVHFTIRESGRLRVISDRQKNVHAWGEGVLVGVEDADIFAPIDLAYDPYAHSTFVQRHTEIPIERCRYLAVRDNRVFVTPDAVPAGSKPDRRIRQTKPSAVQLGLLFRRTAFAAA